MTENIRRACEECVAFHEALRRLGFLPEHIFVEVVIDGRTGKWASFVVLRSPACEEVTLLAWHFDDEAEATAFTAAWKPFVERWNGSMTAEERAGIYSISFVRHHAFDFYMLVARKSGRKGLAPWNVLATGSTV